MKFALLLVAFLVVPLAELLVLLQVGGLIGVLPTIALLALDSIAGALLLKWQGREAWRRFNGALGSGRVPGREVVDGALVIFGGALLLTPGFLTDVLGIALLLPPTRAVVRRVLVRRFAHKVAVSSARSAFAAPGFGAWGTRSSQPWDVEGRVVDDVPPTLRKPAGAPEAERPR